MDSFDGAKVYRHVSRNGKPVQWAVLIAKRHGSVSPLDFPNRDLLRHIGTPNCNPTNTITSTTVASPNHSGSAGGIVNRRGSTVVGSAENMPAVYRQRLSE